MPGMDGVGAARRGADTGAAFEVVPISAECLWQSR